MSLAAVLAVQWMKDVNVKLTCLHMLLECRGRSTFDSLAQQNSSATKGLYRADRGINTRPNRT